MGDQGPGGRPLISAAVTRTLPLGSQLEPSERGSMRGTYATPALLEYGAMFSLTLGAGGHAPDYDINTFHLIANNGLCIVNGHPQYICFSDPNSGTGQGLRS